jgi:hypothetical protein
MSCENDVAKIKIYRIAWLVQSAASFASHVEHFFAEIESHFMYLLVASQAHSFAQWLSELATSQRWNNDVLHSSWCDEFVEYLQRKLFEIKSMSEKRKKHVSFMFLKLSSHCYLFHATSYDIYWLMISLRSIFKWQQRLFMQKALIKTAVRRIRYSIFIARLFHTNKIFLNNEKLFEFATQ